MHMGRAGSRRHLIDATWAKRGNRVDPDQVADKRPSMDGLLYSRGGRLEIQG
jgi:hypothetical protein